MKRTLINKTMLTMALVAVLSIICGLALLIKPVIGVKATTPATFEMLGLSIRYDAAAGEDGIRFGVKLDKATYDTLAADGNATAGILVAPSDVLTASSIAGTTLNLWNAGASGARYGVLYSGSSGTNLWTVEGNYATGIAYLHGFPEASYNRPITAVAYIDWDNDSSAEKMNYSDTVEVSMADVALAVRTDYEGSNTYGTTSSNYTKLDSYLLSYNVNFLDAYNGSVSTASVKYGSELTAPVSYPAARTGYTYTGWYEKTGESTYAGSATDFTASGAKVVKYARTFRAGYTEDGPTYVKPAANNWLYGDGQSVVENGEYSVQGMYLFDDTGVANGSDYMLSATFTRANTTEVGFVITTKAVSEWNGAVNNLAFVYRSGGDMYLWGTSIWRSLGTVSAPALNSEMKLTIVHKAPMFYVFINDTLACSVDENTTTNDGDSTPKNAIGTSGNIRFGLVSQGTVTTFTDWRYSTDSTLIASTLDNDETKPLMDNRVNTAADLNMSATSVKLTTNGNSVATAFFTDVELEQNQNFVIYATVNANFTARNIGFVVGDLSAERRHIMFQWRANDIYLWRNISWAGVDDNKYLPGYGNNTSAKEIALVFKDGWYYMYLNGALTFATPETADVLNDGSTEGLNAYIGTDQNKRIGLSVYDGDMTCTDWGYSTDSDVIATYAHSIAAGKSLGSNMYHLAGGSISGTTLTAASGKATAALVEGVSFSQNQNFVMSVDVVGHITASQVGFVLGVMDGTGSPKTRYNILFNWRADHNFYLWRSANASTGEGGWGEDGYETVDRSDLGLPYGNMTLTFVLKNGTYYMFVNGVKVYENMTGKAGGWNFQNDYLTYGGGTIKVGVDAYNGYATFANFTYSTNSSDINDYVPDFTFGSNFYDQAGGSVNGKTLTATSGNAAAALFEGKTTTHGENFVLSVDVSDITASRFGLAVGTFSGSTPPPERYHLLIQFTSDRKLKITRAANGNSWGQDWTSATDTIDCSSLISTYGSTTITFALYNGNYYVYVGGVKVLQTTGQVNGGSHNLSTSSYTNGGLKFGGSVFEGSATFSNLVFSTNAKTIATYIV